MFLLNIAACLPACLLRVCEHLLDEHGCCCRQELVVEPFARFLLCSKRRTSGNRIALRASKGVTPSSPSTRSCCPKQHSTHATPMRHFHRVSPLLPCWPRANHAQRLDSGSLSRCDVTWARVLAFSSHGLCRADPRATVPIRRERAHAAPCTAPRTAPRPAPWPEMLRRKPTRIELKQEDILDLERRRTEAAAAAGDDAGQPRRAPRDNNSQSRQRLPARSGLTVEQRIRGVNN
mmetsp:Transcript_22504/g.72014  ORF Transcript_22504/g.72014 Transcript_22504/m.72014 type:complete len:234 (+) Transcript_22504:2829-3530(+)